MREMVSQHKGFEEWMVIGERKGEWVRWQRVECSERVRRGKIRNSVADLLEKVLMRGQGIGYTSRLKNRLMMLMKRLTSKGVMFLLTVW